MFRISEGKGFQVTFENGWTVSVQFGVGDYGDHHMAIPRSGPDYSKLSRELAEQGSKRAEVWCRHKDGRRWPEDPKGWVTPDELARIMIWAATNTFALETQED